MPKRDIELELDQLSGVTDKAALQKALRDRVSLIVAKAAGRAGDLRFRELAPELLAAFDRHFAEKSDPQCWAKIAIAKALREIDWAESAPFVRGAEYRQWEPVWGGEAESAGTLRAVCLLAIPNCTDLLRDGKLWILMRGLSDKIAPVRTEAARALELVGGFEAALLLRLKARSGDADSGVTGQVFESLLSVEREGAIPFLLESIEQRGEPERDDEMAEQAALALGASRLPQTCETLIACAENQKLRSIYEPVLRALSISRLENALEYLVGVLANGRERDAQAALAALELHRSTPEIAARVEDAVKERESAILKRDWERLFSQQW